MCGSFDDAHVELKHELATALKCWLINAKPVVVRWERMKMRIAMKIR